jgi:hypothetical protein
MSGVSTPAPPAQQAVLKPIAVSETKIHTMFSAVSLLTTRLSLLQSPLEAPKPVQSTANVDPSMESKAYSAVSPSKSPSMKQAKSKSPTSASMDTKEKKKKKGIFGGLFKKGKKEGKARSSSNGRSLRSQNGRSIKHTEASI